MAGALSVHSLSEMLGEFLTIPERIVVASSWGRWTPQPLRAGDAIEEGDVVGRVWDGRDHIDIVAPGSGLFVAWMAAHGERVRPGMAIARIATTDS